MSRSNSVKRKAMLLAAATLGTAVLLLPSAGAAGDDMYAGLPSSLTLNGVVRDFNEKSVSGGHPDFEKDPTGGFAQYLGEVQDQLDSDGKPVFNSTGYKLSADWKDAKGRAIIDSKSYISAKPGDKAGSKSSTEGGALTSAEKFAQWFRDVPGVNASKTLAVTLVRQPNTNVYTFDDKVDPTYSSRGGFFPINGELFGNSKGETKNFHFTYELQTEFVFEKGKGQVFTFTGDDDVWVFIDGKLVIDIGGVHSAKSQTIEIDRLNWLQDGQTYKLSFFFAERHRTQSNCRIETTMRLRTVQPPVTSGLYD